MNTKELITAVRENVGRVMVGREAATDALLIALLTGGHVLIEDVPGSGKTKLAKTFARSIGCDFKRIQFTPDLLPSDITGIKYFNVKKAEFEFIPGPAFTNILLADELNRATPKTQSGLLECMQESQITIEGETHTLPSPLMVIATQNPIENMGVFPLPEAQLDRFLLKLKMPYPSREESVDILARFDKEDPLDSLEPVCTRGDILAAEREVNEVYIHHDLMGYITDVVAATRKKDAVALGAGTRAAVALMKASKGKAALEGRNYVIPDDVKSLAVSVLAHRLMLKMSVNVKPGAAEATVREILTEIRVPTEDYEKYKL